MKETNKEFLKGISRGKEEKLVEIVRSFSYKLNLGNYQTADFFCSQKAECYENEVEEVSARLYEFCKNEVVKSVNAYKKDLVEPSFRKARALDHKEEAHETAVLELND